MTKTLHKNKAESLYKKPDGIEVGAGPVTDVTGAISIFTGFWFSAKLATPGRLRAARASIKFSEIRTRK